MTWRSFVDFWLMRELGQEDAIMRNYDIMRFAGKGETHLWLALGRIGMREAGTPIPLLLHSVCTALRNVGCAAPNPEQVRQRLIGWYTWDRIRKQEITQWFLSEMVRRQRA